MTDIPAVDIPYDSGARALVRAVQEQMGERSGAMLWGDTTWLDQVVVTWFGLSPADALLPRVLRDDAVWPQGMRDQVVTEVRAILAGRREPHSIGYAHSRIPLTFGPLLNRAHELADQEGIPVVTEWLFARVLSEKLPHGLSSIGISAGSLVMRLGQLLGTRRVAEADAGKVWCFCDTNVLIEGEDFRQANWAEILDSPRPVVVVSGPVLRELDRLKVDPSVRHRNRRARAILPGLLRLTNGVPPGTLVPLPRSGEILVDAREPRFFPHGLDAALMDDRLIAAALDFRWRRQGAEVVLASADVTPAFRARELGLRVQPLPRDFIRQRPASDALTLGIEDAAATLNLAEARVRDLVAVGDIPHFIEEGEVLFDRESLKEWVRERSRAGRRSPS